MHERLRLGSAGGRQPWTAVRVGQRVALHMGKRMLGVLNPLPHPPMLDHLDPQVSGGIAEARPRAD